MRPVLAAVVMLTPKVKDVWATTTPKQPNPAIRSRSLRPGLLAGSRIRRMAYIKRPPTTNLSATIESGGMERAANLVAA